MKAIDTIGYPSKTPNLIDPSATTFQLGGNKPVGCSIFHPYQRKFVNSTTGLGTGQELCTPICKGPVNSGND